MHGRLKVRTTEEQKLIKRKEQQKKLAAYRHVMNQVAASRNEVPFDPTSFASSAQILAVNPDVYTLWNYRKEVILQELRQRKHDDDDDAEARLVAFLDDEIKLTEHCLLNTPKSYSSWYHRYWVIRLHPEPNWEREFVLCTKYLQADDRNLHCWNHRRLILNEIGQTPAKEIQFTTDRLNENFSNYSSWHYRSTLGDLDLGKELELVQSAAFTDPNDSSAWFYLRWILADPRTATEHLRTLSGALDQLLELEGDCKWVLLAKCWLSRRLAFREETAGCYGKLGELDPAREGYYRDCSESLGN